MDIKVPFKAKADTLAVVQAYANINTPNKVVSDALAIRRLTYPPVQAKRVAYTLTCNKK